jgi:hypothetical protein
MVRFVTPVTGPFATVMFPTFLKRPPDKEIQFPTVKSPVTVKSAVESGLDDNFEPLKYISVPSVSSRLLLSPDELGFDVFTSNVIDFAYN